MEAISKSEIAQTEIQLVAPNQSRRYVKGRFSNYISQRLELEAEESVPLDQVLSVEHSDVLFLGTVVSCCSCLGLFRVNVHVEHTLTALGSLMRLREQLVGKKVEHTSPAHSSSSAHSLAEENY